MRLKNRFLLLITIIFMVRRALVGSSIALLGDLYSYQLSILQCSCLGCIIYDWTAMPLQQKVLNFVEIMNEAFILVTVYVMHLFSDFVPDENIRYQFGWYYIYLVFMIFGLNMLIIGGNTIIDVFKYLRFN